MFQRKVYTTGREKIIDFVLGSLALLALNVLGGGGLGLLYWLAGTLSAASPPPPEWLSAVVGFLLPACNSLLLLANLGLIIGLAFIRPWMALGAVSLLGLMFLLALCAGVVFTLYCFSSLNGNSFP